MHVKKKQFPIRGRSFDLIVYTTQFNLNGSNENEDFSPFRIFPQVEYYLPTNPCYNLRKNEN